MITEEEMYYTDSIAKKCENCLHFRRKWISLDKCMLYPSILLDSAVERCLYSKWVPNEKLRKENK